MCGIGNTGCRTVPRSQLGGEGKVTLRNFGVSVQYMPSSHHDSPYFTTNSGAPVWNNNSSLTVGSRGKTVCCCSCLTCCAHC